MKKNLFFCFFIILSHFCFALPNGYSSIELGMTVDEVKSELKKNSDFGYRGDKDVNLLPSTKQTIIETDSSKNPYSFFSRSYFQFMNDRLFSITLELNQEKIDYFSVFSALSKKYGNPSTITPKIASWENTEILMSLEKPLTLKYVDNKVLKEINDKSNVQKTIEEKLTEEFLNSL